jgi:hypothetical protein
MVDVSEVRRRLRQTIDSVRRDAAARRLAADQASADYEGFLNEVAGPVFRHMASALKAEGFPFTLFTPASGLRLASERSGGDFIEIGLETSHTRVTVVGRTSISRGSRLVTHEQPIREGASIRDLTAEDVLEYLLGAVTPFIER